MVNLVSLPHVSYRGVQGTYKQSGEGPALPGVGLGGVGMWRRDPPVVMVGEAGRRSRQREQDKLGQSV